MSWILDKARENPDSTQGIPVTVVRSEKAQNFTCDFCERQYDSSSELYKHISLNHIKELPSDDTVKLSYTVSGGALQCKYCKTSCKELSMMKSFSQMPPPGFCAATL